MPRYRTASALCLALLIAYLLHPSFTSADDKRLAAIETALTGIHSEVTSIHADIRGDHLFIVRRTAALEDKVNALSDRVDTLDAAHEYATLIGQNIRITAIETKLDLARQEREAQKEETKREHDSLMLWLRPGISGMFLALFGAIIGLGAQWWRDKRRAIHEEHIAAVVERTEASALRAETKAGIAAEVTNKERQDRRDERMDDLEREP